MTVLEICVDSVESAIAAESGGAQRIELCNSLIEGGLTPSVGLIRAVRLRTNIGIYVMIRPRAGDFLYSDDDFSVMKDDIRMCAEQGADGVVLGLLTADGDVDIERTRELIDLARPMEVTFHRAIDLTRDFDSALESVIRTGADRVLTSGAELTAMQGRRRIREMVRASKGRIKVMAGGGIRAKNVREIACETGVTEFHAALRSAVTSPIKHQRRRVRLGDANVDDYEHHVVRATEVRALQEAIDAALDGYAERTFIGMGSKRPETE